MFVTKRNNSTGYVIQNTTVLFAHDHQTNNVTRKQKKTLIQLTDNPTTKPTQNLTSLVEKIIVNLLETISCLWLPHVGLFTIYWVV